MVIDSPQAHLIHVSTLSGRDTRPYPASYPGATGGGASIRFPGSCCLSATGVRLLDHPSPAEEFSFPCGRLTEHVLTVRTSSGFSRSTRVRYGRVGCPLYSGTVVLSQLKSFIQLAPAAFQRPVLDLSGAIHLKRLTLTKHSVRGSSPSPVRPFPSPVTPGRNGGSRAFLLMLQTPQLPATPVRTGTGS